MSKTKFPCGCTHDERRWLHMCPEHLEAWYATHQLAAREHGDEQCQHGVIGKCPTCLRDNYD